MLTFYFHTTPNPMKVALMLEELGLDYDTVPVDTRKGEQHEAAFLKINPNAKLPAIDDDGAVVFDSNAICLYLAQKHGRFLATGDRAVAEELSWLFFVATGLSPFSGQAVHFSRVKPDEAYSANRYGKEIVRHYKVLDERLGNSEWLGGAEYGVADIAAWGWVAFAHIPLGEGGLDPYPNVKAWFDRVEAREAVPRARALMTRFDFKTENDEVAMRAMFPQNY